MAGRQIIGAKLNFFAWLNNLMWNDLAILTATAAPTTQFDGKAGVGCLCIDTVAGKLYINTGTKATNVWTVVGSQS